MRATTVSEALLDIYEVLISAKLILIQIREYIIVLICLDTDRRHKPLSHFFERSRTRGGDDLLAARK